MTITLNRLAAAAAALLLSSMLLMSASDPATIAILSTVVHA